MAVNELITGSEAEVLQASSDALPGLWWSSCICDQLSQGGSGNVSHCACESASLCFKRRWLARPLFEIKVRAPPSRFKCPTRVGQLEKQCLYSTYKHFPQILQHSLFPSFHFAPDFIYLEPNACSLTKVTSSFSGSAFQPVRSTNQQISITHAATRRKLTVRISHLLLTFSHVLEISNNLLCQVFKTT